MSEEIKIARETQKYKYIEIPSDLKFRPIVRDPLCSTNKFSKLTNIPQQPFLNKIKTYIRDGINFLNSIPQHTDPHTLMVLFNITNLYSNVPNELGKQVTSIWIEKYPDTLHPRFNKKFVTNMV